MGAGCASFKLELNKSDIFDGRLKAVVLKIVDTAYGGENGFNQAIALSRDTLANVQFVREKKLLTDYMQEIAQDNNKYCFGVRDTIRALEMGAIKTLLVWDELEIKRLMLENPSTKESEAVFLTKREYESGDFQKDKETGVTLDVTEKTDMLEWLAENYKGFGGIGGFLRWQINWTEMDDYLGIDEDDDEAWI